jgi:hypothetical protein
MDKERQVYKLKEAALAELIALALGADKGTKRYEALVNWRKSHEGNFAANVAKVCALARRERGHAAAAHALAHACARVIALLCARW